MKIIFLNTLNAKIHDKIEDYIKSEVPTTDVFCLQEVHPEMRALAKEILTDYEEIFGYKKITEKEYYSVATYVRKGLSISASKTVSESDKYGGLGVYAEVIVNEKPMQIVNFHGIPVHDKLDTPETIQTSQGIIDMLKEKEGLKIVGGDFNVLPDTKSISMFGNAGYKRLIKEYNIPTTRNELAWERFPAKLFFSDYIFTSPELQIQSFEVPNMIVSDHLPLLLEFEV